MKKACILILVAVIAIMNLSAAKGEIGGTLYPEVFISTSDGSTILGAVVMAEGANYFGADGGFGIEYGIGGWFPLAQFTSEGSEFIGSAALLTGKVGLAYDFPIGESFDLALSLGLKVRTILIVNLFDIYGTVTASFDVGENVAVKTGVTAGGTIFGTMPEIGDQSAFATEGVPIVVVAPFVGVSFVY